MDNPNTIVYIDDSVDKSSLEASFPDLSFACLTENEENSIFLMEKKGKLGVSTGGKSALFMDIDFSSADLQRRKRRFSPKNEPLLKAIGKVDKDSFIVDGTAGLGRESFLLMSFGYKVVGLEQSPYLWILLKSGLKRLVKTLGLDEDRQRLDFYLGESLSVIESKGLEPEVLYLDPMFPESKKSAKVKKPMQILQKMELKNVPAKELLRKALTLNIPRVVFKRPKEAEMLDREACREYYENDTVRFEVY